MFKRRKGHYLSMQIMEKKLFTATLLFLVLIFSPYVQSDTYQIGIEGKSETYALYSLTLPADASVTYSGQDGSCRADGDGYCSFEFDEPAIADFSGVNHLCKFTLFGVARRGSDRVSTAFEIGELSIRKEFFDKGIFKIEDGKLRFNDENVPKDPACYKEENGNKEYCVLRFYNGKIKDAVKDFKYVDDDWIKFKGVEVRSHADTAKEELAPEKEIWISVGCAEKGEIPLKDTEILINGKYVEDIEEKLDKITTIEYDFGGNIVPLRIFLKKGRDEEFRMISGLLIENAEGLSRPEQSDFLKRLNEFVGKGGFRLNREKVTEELLKYLATDIKRKADSDTKIFALMPEPADADYGLRTTELNIDFADFRSGPDIDIDFETEKVPGGKKAITIKAEAVRRYFPKILEFAEGLKESGIEYDEEGKIKKIDWLNETDEGSENETATIFEKEYEFEGDEISAYIDDKEIADALEKLRNGEYHFWVKTIPPEFERSIRGVISSNEGNVQFSLKNQQKEEVIINNKYTDVKIADKSDTSALVQIDDEKCESVADECWMGISPNEAKPFYRLVGKSLLLAMQSPDDPNEVVITIIPFSEEEGEEKKVKLPPELFEEGEKSDLIQNLRVVKGFQEGSPLRQYPIYAKEGEELEFTQILEKVVFNFEFDRANSIYILEVKDLEGNEAFYKTSYIGKNLRDVAAAAASPQTENLFKATEFWLGVYGVTDKEKDERKPVPEGKYTLNVRICTTSECTTTLKTDQAIVEVKKFEVKQVEPEKQIARIKVKAIGTDDEVLLEAKQGTSGGRLSEGNEAEVVFVSIANPQIIPLPKEGMTVLAEIGGPQLVLKASSGLQIKVHTMEVKGDDEYIFDFSLPARASPSPTPVVKADRNILITDPIYPDNKFAITVTGYFMNQKLGKTSEKQVIAPIPGAPLGQQIMVKMNMRHLQTTGEDNIITGEEEQTRLAYNLPAMWTLTRSRQIDFLFNEDYYSSTAKKPNFRVKIINIPSEEKIAGLTIKPVLDDGGIPGWFTAPYELSASEFSYMGGPDKAAYSKRFEGIDYRDDLEFSIYDAEGRQLYYKKANIGNVPHYIYEVDFSELDFTNEGEEDKVNIIEISKNLGIQTKHIYEKRVNDESAYYRTNSINQPTPNFVFRIRNVPKDEESKLLISPLISRGGYGGTREERYNLLTSPFVPSSEDSKAYSFVYESENEGVKFNDQLYFGVSAVGGKIVFKDTFRLIKDRNIIELDYEDFEFESGE